MEEEEDHEPCCCADAVAPVAARKSKTAAIVRILESLQRMSPDRLC
jgi:hypothetical protein